MVPSISTIMMTHDEAREHVSAINNAAADMGRRLVELKEREGWRALGYRTWTECLEGEFDYSRQHLYELMKAFVVLESLSSTLYKDKLSTRAAAALADFEPSIRPTILQTAQARYGEITESNLSRVGRVVSEMATTGHVDTGSGVSTPIDAALEVEDYEALQRHREHKNGMKPKRNYTAGAYEPIGLDACQTPPYALTPLLPYLDKNLKLWEPASGEGFIVSTLRGAGYRVVEGDILHGQNFFDYEPDDYDVHLTNPPYGIKFDWLARCYQLGKPFALLLPVETIGTKQAQSLMQQHGFEMMLLDNRVDFKHPDKGFESSAQFPVLWLCWNVLPQQVVFGHISEEKSAWKSSMISIPAMQQAS